MTERLRQIGWLFLALAVAAPPALAQQALEERPEIKKLSREELDRRKADELVRDAQSLFGLGVMRHRGDRWLEAVTLLEGAARLDPQTPAASRALIPLYLSLAREEDALEACRKVLKLDPADADTAFQLAKLLRSDGRTREAIAALAQGAESKRAEDRPDLLYFMLGDLADLQEKAPDFPAAALTYRRLAKHLLDRKARLLGSDTLTVEQHAVATARAYEKVGHCLLQQKQFGPAVKAFLESRDYLAKHADSNVRQKAVRLNWNLAQACMAQDKWEDALNYLNAYLENRPTDPEPYEKEVFLLKQLDRPRDIVPTLKRYAERMPDTLGIQLLYAQELAEAPGGRAEAERRYRDLADRFGTADVYRGLFRLHQSGGQMIEVLNLVDQVFATINAKDEMAADVRERARDRGRAMLEVLRNEPALVNSLLPVALREFRAGPERTFDTGRLLAALAARSRQLDKAEAIMRQLLLRVPIEQEAAVYSGLLEVLYRQRKYDDMIAVCKEALDGPRKVQATNLLLFHHNLALAWSEKPKFDESITEIDKAIRLAAEGRRIIERCLKARILARAERYDAAVAECEEMLKELTQADEIKQVRYTLASVYTIKGEHDKSDAQLAKILEEDPSDPEANNNLGYQWADRSRNLDEAERLIRKAIEVDRLHRRDDPEIDPENAAYLDSLGWVLFRKGKLEEARDWLEKAAALPAGADDPTVWDHLGDVYFKLKLTRKAKDAWQSAIKLYEHDKHAQKEGRQEEARRKLKLAAE